MNYYIYQMTNNVNGKIYIGKHKTKKLDDGYFGSGKLLKRAIEKYGKENFTKTILFEVDSEEELNDKEKELVTEEFCLRDDTYNLCVGGQGGFSYINREYWNAETRLEHNRKVSGFKTLTPEQRVKYSQLGVNKRLELISSGEFKTKEYSNKGRALSDEHSKAISLAKKGTGTGSSNSQYGRKFKWMNNGNKNRKVPLDQVDTLLISGWGLGKI